MSDFGRRFVVDTNALIRLKRHRRASSLFLDHAALPSEVLREAAGLSDIRILRERIYPTTPQVLECLVRVMNSVPASDRKLVDLYSNHGGADPLVVACALDGQERDSPYLDAPEWFVVTNDDAVRDKAMEFGLHVISSDEFANMIDADDAPRENVPAVDHAGALYLNEVAAIREKYGIEAGPPAEELMPPLSFDEH